VTPSPVSTAQQRAILSLLGREIDLCLTTSFQGVPPRGPVPQNPKGEPSFLSETKAIFFVMSDALENIRQSVVTQESKKAAQSAELTAIGNRIESLGMEVEREIELGASLDESIENSKLMLSRNETKIRDARIQLTKITQDYTETLILSQSIDAKIASIQAQQDKNEAEDRQFLKQLDDSPRSHGQRGCTDNLDIYVQVTLSKDEFTDFLRSGRH
jgi:hypothetical protein